MRANLIDLAVITTPMTIKKPLKKIPLRDCQEILIGGEKYKYLEMFHECDKMSSKTRTVHKINEIEHEIS